MNNILFHPFEEYSEKKLLSFGIVLTLTGSFLAYFFNGRFDGVLDLHFTDQVRVLQPFLDNLINITCLSIFLYFAGFYVNRKTRFIDLLTTAIIARIPYYTLVLFNINNFINGITETLKNFVLAEGIVEIEPFNVGVILIFSICVFAFLTWYLVLLYNGFKVASHAKGFLPMFLFFLAVIIAEAVSKYIIYLINY